MTDSISGFKIFSRAPYKRPDSKAFTELLIDGIRGEEKIYGPFFTTTFIKYALRAIAKMTGEEQAEDIKTLDQLTEYLLSKTENLPVPPYFLVLWAQFVTDKKFEGSQAVGTQIMYRSITKRAAESEGDMSLLQKVDVEQILERLRQLAVDMKVAPLEFGYKKNKDGSMDVLHGSCLYSEGCQMSLKQDLLKRPDGRMACGASVFVCQFLKMGTHHEWDYTVLKFDKSHCIVKYFMI